MHCWHPVDAQLTQKVDTLSLKLKGRCTREDDGDGDDDGSEARGWKLSFTHRCSPSRELD